MRDEPEVIQISLTDRIMRFLFSCPSPSPFEVSASGLWKCRSGEGFVPQRKHAALPRGRSLDVGEYAMLTFRPCLHRLVRVTRVEQQVDPQAVTASIAAVPDFARALRNRPLAFFWSSDFSCLGFYYMNSNQEAISVSFRKGSTVSQGPNSANTHAFHAAFLLACCRTMQAASSTCERVGSLLGRLFDKGSNMTPSRVASRLRLYEMGFEGLGGDRDEAFVKDVARALLDSGKRPHLTRKGKAARVKKGRAETGIRKLAATRKQSNRKASLANYV